MKNENKNIKLDQIARDGEFNVPEGYFDTLNKDIMAAIRLEEEKPSSKPAKVVPLFNRVPKSLYYVMAAASILIGILLFNTDKEEECQTFACLLDRTEITSSDIELLEEEESTDFLDDDYNDEFLNI